MAIDVGTGEHAGIIFGDTPPESWRCQASTGLGQCRQVVLDVGDRDQLCAYHRKKIRGVPEPSHGSGALDATRPSREFSAWHKQVTW